MVAVGVNPKRYVFFKKTYKIELNKDMIATTLTYTA